MLTPEEKSRYARHLIIPEIGEAGQLRLKNASVLLIGTGGLGSPAALYLAAAGVGRLGLIDPDTVDLSNLQRQLLHSDATVGKSKLESAAARLRETNPHITLDLHPVRFTPENAIGIAENYDIILDGSDNFPTRFLANDTAFFLKKPLIYGAIHRFDGQMTVFAPHIGGPCYRCLLPEIPPPGAVPSCNEAGVLGVLPGIIGSLQAMEAIKLILGTGQPPLGKILIYDALATSFRTLKLPHDPACRLCGDNPTITSVNNPETTADPSCQITDPTMQTITAAELKSRLDSGDLNALLIDVREQEEWDIIHIPQAKLVPLQTIPTYAPNLPKDTEIIIHCKAGMRSAKACEYLTSLGYENVVNVEGGMDAFQKL
ncbi:MAG: molybdopterin-synthase adenylyltransferase MoeB [Akkermansiaceae bacterium]|nr:molybdopterin-synthase adenylyltransferase MoeB [Akkermansiaceae bacterium]